jgi:hypothetical protein
MNIMCERLDMDDLPHTDWKCDDCGAVNSCLDAECQYCGGGSELDPDA